MTGKIKSAFVSVACCLLMATATAQDAAGKWTLRRCIDYARENNLQVQTSLITQQSTEVSLQEAKAQWIPSLGFSSGQNFVNEKRQNEDGSYSSNGTYSGSYALNANVTLYGGGKLANTVKQQQIAAQSSSLNVATAQNDIEIAVTQAYLDILYANESVKINQQTVESSEAQLVRSKALYEAGSISQSDYAQIESQLSSDRYQLTVSENTLAQARLTLKQLLELGLDEPFEVDFPELGDDQVMAAIPSVASVYSSALAWLPEVQSSQLNIQSAEVGEKIATAEKLPTITANAAIGTGNYSGSNYSFYNQLNNQLNESAGITISVPIFSNRKARSSIAQARLQTQQAEIDYLNTEKNLLKTVESLYQDAVSAQSRYLSASDQVKSAKISYDLVSAQFDEGMKNTVELLTEKNNYLSAQMEQLQAKYQAVLSIKLLNFYCNQPIEL